MAPEDSRFARLQTDPRFRRTKQKNLKVEIDDRFKDVLQSEEFGGKGAGKGRVDKRGRKLGASHGADQLKHFYRLKSPPEAGDDVGEKSFVDYARGEGALESSGSEGEDDSDESEVEDEELELGPRKAPAVRRFLEDRSDVGSDDESDEDHLDIDLSEDEKPAASVFPDEEGEDAEADEEEEQYAEPTKRIAAVNLDWDNLRAGDLFTIFNSFLKPTGKNGESSTSVGKLLSVKIYPSEFGKKRLETEEREGPGGGMFVSKKGEKGKGKRKSGIEIHRDEESGEDDDVEAQYEEIDDDEYENEVYEPSDEEGDDLDDEDLSDGDDGDSDEFESSEDDEEPPRRRGPKEIDGLEIVSDVESDAESDAGSEDIDMDQLRQYQLERLRYWYAVATFSTVDAAMRVLAECNGAEFEMTANMFDLSYVPDEMDFDDSEIKDEATKEPKAYKGNDFVTDALRHSKVKLTWDQDDPNRSKLTRRNLTKDQIEEEDFKAYLASSGSESDGNESETDAAAAKAKKGKKGKKASKSEADRLRALLLNGDDEDGDVWGKAGLSAGDTGKADKKCDMEITFRPGLSSGSALGKDDENLTTLEKYQMRMKEKKARKKEKAELKRADKDDAPAKKADKDDFFGDSDDESDAGVDVPDTLPEDEREPEDDDADVQHVLGDAKGVEHFSMKDVLKAEKEGGKKKRSRNKKKKHADEREVELGKEGWKIDVKDERFKALHEEPEFAIDPSNPHFVKTKAMTDLLAERKKRKGDQGDRPPVEKGVKRSNAEENAGEKDLSALVQSVKRRAGDGTKKPRKRSRK